MSLRLTKNKHRLVYMLCACCCIVPTILVAEVGILGEGKDLAFERSKGNCLACHMIQGGENPGNIGPPLVHMRARYPSKIELRAQIWDATVSNPDSSMPPFGRHLILTEDEIDKIVEFICSL